MTIEEFKEYALRTMLEENLWENGEKDIITFMGVRYKIEFSLGYFELSTYNAVKNEWNSPKVYNKITSLFKNIFKVHNILP